jgi:hypothetical protein
MGESKPTQAAAGASDGATPAGAAKANGESIDLAATATPSDPTAPKPALAASVAVGGGGAVAPARSTQDVRWQKHLVPFMVGMIAVCTLSFISFGVYQIAYLDETVEAQPPTPTIALDQVHPLARPFYVLEEDLLARRYHQANVLLLSRTTVQFLGFMTGMLLSLIGATFVLGKLREGQTEIRGTGPGGAALGIASASPGLVLSTLGVVLMLTTVAINHQIALTDHAVYLSSAEITDDQAPEPSASKATQAPPIGTSTASAPSDHLTPSTSPTPPTSASAVPSSVGPTPIQRVRGGTTTRINPQDPVSGSAGASRKVPRGSSELGI